MAARGARAAVGAMRRIGVLMGLVASDLDYRFRESCHKRGIHLSFQAPICAGALRTKD
jgi:hypothetical protein